MKSIAYTAVTALRSHQHRAIKGDPSLLVTLAYNNCPEARKIAAFLNDEAARHPEGRPDEDLDALCSLVITDDLDRISSEVENPTSWDALNAVAANSNTPGDLLVSIVILAEGQDYDDDLAEIAVSQANLPSPVLDWATRARAGHSINAAAARNANLTLDQQQRLAAKNCTDVLQALAENPAVDQGIRIGVETRIFHLALKGTAAPSSPHASDLAA